MPWRTACSCCGSTSARSRSTELPEPDYRFTLANERTFLAWVRTSLALLAGGIALSEVVPRLAVPGAREALAAGCIGLSLVLTVAAFGRWRAVQHAMYEDRPLPRQPAVLVLAGGVVLVAALSLVLVALD